MTALSPVYRDRDSTGSTDLGHYRLPPSTSLALPSLQNSYAPRRPSQQSDFSQSPPTEGIMLDDTSSGGHSSPSPIPGEYSNLSRVAQVRQSGEHGEPGGLRPRPSKRRAANGMVGVGLGGALDAPRRSDSRQSNASSSGGGKRLRKMRSDLEPSLLDERLKIANVVLPEDGLEDLMHLPIAPELVSRRQRARDASGGTAGYSATFPRSRSTMTLDDFGPPKLTVTSTATKLGPYQEPPSPTSNLMDNYYAEFAATGLAGASREDSSSEEAVGSSGKQGADLNTSSSSSRIPQLLPNSSSAAFQSRIPQRGRGGTMSGGEESNGAGRRRASGSMVNDFDLFSTSMFPTQTTDDESQWEVLQPAGGQTSTRTPVKKSPTFPAGSRVPRKSTTGYKQAPGRIGAKNTHGVSASVSSMLSSDSSHSNSPSRPPNRPRPRANTNNIPTTARKLQAATSVNSKRTPTLPASAGTSRKASAPLAKGPPRAGARPRSLSTSSAAVDGPIPPWVTDQGPRLYRVNPAAEGAQPVFDDLILPVVARQLEKERMAGAPLSDLDGYVTEWDTDKTSNDIVRLERGRSPVAEMYGPEPPLSAPVEREHRKEERPPPMELESPPLSPKQQERRESRSKRGMQPPASAPLVATTVALPVERQEAWPSPPAEVQQPMAQQRMQTEYQEKKGSKEDSHGGGCCRCTIM